jgi:hypothetical protein
MALLARRRLGFVAVVAALCAAPAGMARAQEMDVAPAIQIPILVKVMTFDRQLRVRAPEGPVVGIVFQSGNRASTLAKDDVVRSLGTTRDVDGERFRVVAIDLDRERLEEALRTSNVTVLYVTPLRATDVGALAAIARAAHVTTVTGVPRYVSLGLGIGVGQRGGRPRILINVEATRLEGAEFGAELLKLAEIVK